MVLNVCCHSLRLARKRKKVSTYWEMKYLLSDGNKNPTHLELDHLLRFLGKGRETWRGTKGKKKEAVRGGNASLCKSEKGVPPPRHTHLHKQGVGWGPAATRLSWQDAHEHGTACTAIPGGSHTPRCSPGTHSDPGKCGKGETVKWERRGTG